MSVPISETMTSAVRRCTPGIVHSSSTAGSKGAIFSPIASPSWVICSFEEVDVREDRADDRAHLSRQPLRRSNSSRVPDAWFPSRFAHPHRGRRPRRLDRPRASRRRTGLAAGAAAAIATRPQVRVGMLVALNLGGDGAPGASPDRGQRAELERVAAVEKRPWQEVQRARIVLYAEQGFGGSCRRSSTWRPSGRPHYRRVRRRRPRAVMGRTCFVPRGGGQGRVEWEP